MMKSILRKSYPTKIDPTLNDKALILASQLPEVRMEVEASITDESRSDN